MAGFTFGSELGGGEMKIVISDGFDGQAEERMRVKRVGNPMKKSNLPSIKGAGIIKKKRIAYNFGSKERGVGGEQKDPDDNTNVLDYDWKDRVSVESLKKLVPTRSKRYITENHVNIINAALDDQDYKDVLYENFFTWFDVMHTSQYKIESYANAVKYCTHKLMGNNNLQAYIKTFPAKHEKFVAKGKAKNVINGHVSMYNKSDLVVKIMERSLIPVWIMNSGILQEAINMQATLMRDAKSETVRMKAAATLIEHLKQPENVKVDLNVGVSNDTVEDLRDITRSLAVEQRRMIQAGGMSARDVAEMRVVKKYEEEGVLDAEFVEK